MPSCTCKSRKSYSVEIRMVDDDGNDVPVVVERLPTVKNVHYSIIAHIYIEELTRDGSV